MRKGQVLTSPTIKHRELDSNGKIAREFGFKVPKRGQLFNFIFMGVSDKDRQIDADQFLRDMGWVPMDEVAKLKEEL